MSLYSIYFWHGKNLPQHRSKDEKELFTKLQEICVLDEDNDTPLFYDGGLENFRRVFGEKFIFLPHASDPEMNGTICVTHHDNFGQR